ncbi:MAG TPA: class I SAM-dependent RNA methyltransferase [Dehalococcoidia bacterium]|nr:class I SAM-dependent RNA methyltransferase [Dehalococcoidia bacterium]
MSSTLRVSFTDIAFAGDAIARRDGQVLFAPYAIPGEEAVVRVVKEKRDYLMGEVVEIVAPSPHRVEPPCPLFGRCSGCQWQHIAYPYQLELKRRVVQEQLRRFGKFPDPPVAPTIGAEDPWHYRNHARFTVDAEGALCFVHRQSRELIPIPYCYIVHPRINDMLAQLQGRPRGATQLNIRYGVNTGSFLISPRLDLLKLPLPTGQPYYEEKLLGRTFRIAAASFFQVNTAQAEALVRKVIERLAPTGDEVVIDAYAGVGTFGILMATYVKHVVAIEEAAPALADAEVNAEGLGNITFIRGKTEQALWALGEPANALILDPPRSGCHRRALEALLKLSPSKAIYVSCDPATLARDLRILCEGRAAGPGGLGKNGGYRLLEVQPLDMFPHTYHIECVATLAR